MMDLVSLDDIKAVATPKEVAVRFLGEPDYKRGGSYWYCSPFRNETHPSFKVSDIGMYDFGSDKSYSIFEFVQKLKRCSFQESVNLLAELFGISSRSYESKRLADWYKKRRQEEERHREEVHQFYLAVWDEVDKEYHENQECLEIFKGNLEDDAYKICLDRQASVWGMEEYLAQGVLTFEDEEELLEIAKRGELPRWLQFRVTKYIMSLEKSKQAISQRLRF